MTDPIDHPQYERATCYFCLSEETHVLETHHIVPKRFGGSDDPENLVRVCPTCHQKLERLYDDRFYDELGVGDAIEGRDTDDTLDRDDIEVITGREAVDRDGINTIEDLVIEMQPDSSDGVPIPDVISRAEDEGMSSDRARHSIQKLMQKGELYEVRHNRVRATHS